MGHVRDLLDRLPHIYKTMFGHCVIKTVRLENGDLVRVLQVGGVYQSASYVDERRLDPVFSYYFCFDHAFDGDQKPTRVLMIGGGGYSWPKHVAKDYPFVSSLDVVEIDPAVTSLARKWFFLDECMQRYPGVINPIEADGRSYLQAAPASSYDCIAIDAFSGCEPVVTLATVEAAVAAARVLGPSGVLVSNVVSANEGQDVSFLFRYMSSLREAFEHVYVLPCDSDELAVEDNYIVYATNGSVVPDGVLPYEDSMLLAPMRDGG